MVGSPTPHGNDDHPLRAQRMYDDLLPVVRMRRGVSRLDDPAGPGTRSALRELPRSVLAGRGHALRAGGRGSAEGSRTLKTTENYSRAVVGDVKIGPIVLTAIAAVILVIGLLGLGAVALSQLLNAVGVATSALSAVGWGLVFLAVAIAILYILSQWRND